MKGSQLKTCAIPELCARSTAYVCVKDFICKDIQGGGLAVNLGGTAGEYALAPWLGRSFFISEYWRDENGMDRTE